MHHAGSIRTHRRIQLGLNWHWLGVSGDTLRLVCTYKIHTMYLLSNSGNRQRLYVGRPWLVLSVDLVGPLIPTKAGNTIILVLRNHFTRWRDAIAHPNFTAEVVAAALENQVFLLLGSAREASHRSVNPVLTRAIQTIM